MEAAEQSKSALKKAEKQARLAKKAAKAAKQTNVVGGKKADEIEELPQVSKENFPQYQEVVLKAEISGRVLHRDFGLHIWNVLRKSCHAHLEEMGVDETNFRKFLSSRSHIEEMGVDETNFPIRSEAQKDHVAFRNLRPRACLGHQGVEDAHTNHVASEALTDPSSAK
ncbi:hypothetical protein CEK25_004147 [Fusarium fujikuroi]|nr:hypothetical protein CEK25_004147 [Fusarium fujikuroi]